MSNRPNTKRTRRATAPTRQHAEEPKPWWQSPVVWVVGLVAVAVVVAIAVAATGGDSSDDQAAGGSTETAFAEIIDPPLPPFNAPDPAVGTLAPRFTAQELGGERQTVGSDGTARLIGFFAHWCPHCQREVPTVTSWLATDPLPAGVELVAISTSVDQTADNYPPSAWFARENWPAPVYIDDVESPIATGYGLTGFPFWVAVDAEGTVVARTSGETTVEQLDELVAAIAPSSQ